MSCHSVTISPVENPNRLIIALQLTHAGTEDVLTAYADRYVFLQGTLSGLLGSEETECLSNVQARRLVATEARSAREFSPRCLDGNCSVGLVCARTGEIRVFNDSQGFRRMFYHEGQDVFVVSTRLPLILRLLDRDWTLDPMGARVYLAAREPRWPLSAVRDIKTLPPVHRLVERDGKVHLASFWRPVRPAPRQDRGEVARQLHRALRLAVRRGTTGKKTIVTQSGGFDSTCLAKLATSLDCDIRGMSGGYDVQKYATDYDTYNETQHASRIAAELGIGFDRRLFALDDVRHIMAVLPHILDQPGHDPTTFFLFCRAARENGCQAVITGMGGDACFTPKTPLARPVLFLPGLRLISGIPLGQTALGVLTKAVRGRGPFAVCQAYLQGQRPQSVSELLDRCRLLSTSHVSKELLGETIIDDLNEVSALRATVLSSLIENAGCAHEWHYYWAVWTNPDEYHADFAITQSGMQTVMPFLEPIHTSILLSHATQGSLDTRDFEMEVVGGIPQGSLLPSKSGFSLPYERWARELLLDDLEEILADDSWLRLGLNMARVSHYANILRSPDQRETGPLDRRTAALLWRATMLKNYARANSLRIR